jgi:signal transduction histidine kinase
VGTGEQLRVDIHDDGASGGDPRTSTGAPVDLQGHPALRLASEPGGNGLVGIRERAASCGGELTIGVSPLGGWQLTVLLAVGSEQVRRVS